MIILFLLILVTLAEFKIKIKNIRLKLKKKIKDPILKIPCILKTDFEIFKIFRSCTFRSLKTTIFPKNFSKSLFFFEVATSLRFGPKPSIYQCWKCIGIFGKSRYPILSSIGIGRCRYFLRK
jgi:hypothetical protein